MQTVPALNLARHHVGGLQVSCPDARGQAIFGVVGEFGDSVEIGIVEGLDADDRPEDFFAHDLHVAIGTGENRRFDEIALVADDVAARDDLGAFLPSRLEEAPDALMLLFGDQRPEIDRGIEAVADVQLAGFGGDAFDDLVIDRLVREQPRARRAALALIVEDRARRSRDRRVRDRRPERRSPAICRQAPAKPASGYPPPP